MPPGLSAFLGGFETGTGLKRQNHPGEVGCEILGCYPPPTACRIDDLNPPGRPPLYYHEVIEFPVRNGGNRDVLEMGRFQGKCRDAEAVRSRGFGNRLRSDSVPTGPANFA